MPDQPMPSAVEAAGAIQAAYKAGTLRSIHDVEDMAAIISEKMAPAIEAAFTQGIELGRDINLRHLGAEDLWEASKARAALATGKEGER